MSSRRKYKLISAFLLIVFSLNTVVGFACSIGIDMGYNSNHHDEEKPEAVVHIHKNGKEHVHYEKKGKHDHSNSHHGSPSDSKSKEDKDGCCNDEVLQIQQLDKSVPQSPSIIHPIFINSFFGAFYSASLPSLSIVKNIKQFVRSDHPPIPDIRIAIQSFQI